MNGEETRQETRDTETIRKKQHVAQLVRHIYIHYIVGISRRVGGRGGFCGCGMPAIWIIRFEAEARMKYK